MPRITYNQYYKRRELLLDLLEAYPVIVSTISHQRHVDLDRYFVPDEPLTHGGLHDHWRNAPKIDRQLPAKATKTLFRLCDTLDAAHHLNDGDPDKIRQFPQPLLHLWVRTVLDQGHHISIFKILIILLTLALAYFAGIIT